MYQASKLSGSTLAGQVAGTAAYMAPEQIVSFRECRPAADQYAVAATLYNLLTGRHVHDFPAAFQERLLLILNEKAVPIRSRRPEVPEGLARVIHRALAKDPASALRTPERCGRRARWRGGSRGPVRVMCQRG